MHTTCLYVLLATEKLRTEVTCIVMTLWALVVNAVLWLGITKCSNTLIKILTYKSCIFFKRSITPQHFRNLNYMTLVLLLYQKFSWQLLVINDGRKPKTIKVGWPLLICSHPVSLESCQLVQKVLERERHADMIVWEPIFTYKIPKVCWKV
jgi:hypothetical protein